MPWHEAREYRLRARVHRAEKEAQQRHSHRVADDVGGQPGEQLQHHGAECQTDDVVFLADARRCVGQDEAADCDAGLGGVSDALWWWWNWSHMNIPRSQRLRIRSLLDRNDGS